MLYHIFFPEILFVFPIISINDNSTFVENNSIQKSIGRTVLEIAYFRMSV